MSTVPLMRKPHGNGDSETEETPTMLTARKPHGNGNGSDSDAASKAPYSRKPHGNGNGSDSEATSRMALPKKPHGNGDGADGETQSAGLRESKPHGNGDGSDSGSLTNVPLISKLHGNGDDSDSSGEEHGTVRKHRSSLTHRTNVLYLNKPESGSPRVSDVSVPKLPELKKSRTELRKIRKLMFLRIGAAIWTVVTLLLFVSVIYFASYTPPIQYCRFKDDQHIQPRDINHPDVFDDMTKEEYLAVRNFMMGKTELDLTPWEAATPASGYIFSTSLVLPKKHEAMQYLDKGSKQPERKAKVVVVRGNKDPPVVEEYIVSPLPKPTSAVLFKNPSFKRNPIPYTSRPIDVIDYRYLFPVIYDKVTEQMYPLLMESYGLCFHNCTKGVNCLNIYDVAPRGHESGDRSSYTWLFPAVDGYYVHPLGLEFLIDHKSPDINKWKVVKVIYNGQIFNSVDALMEAYNKGTLKLIKVLSHKQVPPYSTYEPRGKLSEKPVQGPKLTEPEGKRFSIHGQHVVYGKWSFFYHMRPSTGLMLFDVRFDDTRIAYEISLQEVLVFYTGYGAAQGNTDYYDVSWLIGSLNMELVRGVDCPDTSVFLSTYFMTNSGKPEHYKNNVCVFENNGGMPLRRHFANDFQGSYDFYGGLNDYHLIIRTMANVWNYDYVFDYVFYTNGAVEVMVSPTGYVQSAYRLPQEEQYGSAIHDHVMADLHQHIFNFKVDLDIVGTSNRFSTLDIGLETVNNPWLPGQNKTQMKITKVLIEKETNVSTFLTDTPQYHLISNKLAKNPYGEERSYRIINKSPVKVLMAEQSIAASAKWAKYPIIITKRKDTEEMSTSLYAQHDPWEPIHDFDAYIDGDNLVDEDLVAWVTVGTHHIPGSEDVPSTPTNWNHLSFFLAPHNYFTVDPSTSSRDTVVIRPKQNGGVDIDTYGRSFQSTCVPDSVGPYGYDGRRAVSDD